MIETVLNFFVASAHADAVAVPATGGAQPNSGLPMMVMLGVFVVFMYLAVWRPQSKRAKEQRNLLNSLARGDEVMTAGGILGRISKMTDTYVVLEISEKIEMTLQKSAIVTALPKGTLKAI